ncbi:MAG: hypothetical protein R3320_05270 [Nitriliruptorales bacterium]|nr:hypothetical protein [Nitriliruptorales bacterium]
MRPCGKALWNAALVGVAALAAVAAVTTSPAAAAPVPSPVVIDRVDVDSGEVEILPAVTGVNPDASGDVIVEHRIVNGTDVELRIRLEIQGLGPGTPNPDPDASVDTEVVLAADELQLAPQEAAAVASVASGVTTGVAYAVVATVPDAEPPVSITSVVLAAAGPAEVSIGEPSLSTERLIVPVTASQAPVLVDAAVRLRTWAGQEILHFEEPGLIGWDTGEPVELSYTLDGLVLPGPYYVDVVAGAGAGEARETYSTWLFPEVTVMAATSALVALAALAVGIVWVRRRRRSADRPVTGTTAVTSNLPASTQNHEEHQDG